MRGDVQAQRRTGGSMRYKVTSTETLRRIRTAAGLPPPFGHPPHKCGGQGIVLILGAFLVGSAYLEIATRPLTMTVVDGGWHAGCCNGGLNMVF